jgi:hypothetical protein
MKGKVISVRLSYEQIIGCTDIYRLTGRIPNNLSHIISTTVATLVEGFRNAGRIRRMSNEEAREILVDQYAGKEIEISEILLDSITESMRDTVDFKEAQPEDFSPGRFQPPPEEPPPPLPAKPAAVVDLPPELLSELTKAISEIQEEDEINLLDSILR